MSTNTNDTNIFIYIDKFLHELSTVMSHSNTIKITDIINILKKDINYNLHNSEIIGQMASIIIKFYDEQKNIADIVGSLSYILMCLLNKYKTILNNNSLSLDDIIKNIKNQFIMSNKNIISCIEYMTLYLNDAIVIIDSVIVQAKDIKQYNLYKNMKISMNILITHYNNYIYTLNRHINTIKTISTEQIINIDKEESINFIDKLNTNCENVITWHDSL